MWQRFTDQTRQIILLAQQEAGEMNSMHVGTEHLLLGILVDNQSVAAQILQEMGVNLQKVRSQIEAEQNVQTDQLKEPMLTSNAKRVLENAAYEARRLHNDYIGIEHLALGLLNRKQGRAAKVLRDLGLNFPEAGAYIVEALRS